MASANSQVTMLLLVICPCIAPAGEPAASGDENLLDEIVVTARRREEPLQRVPIAVTALDEQQLIGRQIAELYDVQYVAPTLVIWPVLGNSITATMSMRGLVEPDLLPTNDATVGIFLDNVYIARTTGANLELVDTERIEVLRGPQGTLFGRNTIGGTINLVTNKPGPETQGSLSLLLGNYSLAEVTGVINLPIEVIDGAARIAARHSAHDGYGDAIALNRELSDDHTNFVRAQLEVHSSERWTVNLSADVTDVDTASQLVTLVAAFPPDADQIPAAVGNPGDVLDNYTGVTDGRVLSNRVGGFDARIRGTSATATADFSDFTFTSISAYRDLDLGLDNSDLDGTPYDIGAVVLREQVERQFSQEFQVQAHAPDETLVWTAGAHYFTESGSLLGHNLALVPINDKEVVTNGTAYNDSWSAYLHATWQVLRAVHLTGGLRYNVDERQLVSRNSFVIGGVKSCGLDEVLLDSPGVCQATLPVKRYSYVPALIGIDYLPSPGLLVYAKVSRGYRAGGYNMRGGTPAELVGFEPEEVTSYEIGSKSDLLGDRMRINLAVYDAEYKDVQLGVDLTDPDGPVVFAKQNGGRGRILGGELEITGLLGGLELYGSVGITHGEFVELDSNVVSVGNNTPLGLPRDTYMFGADFPFKLKLGRVRLHADYAWRSTDTDDEFSTRCRCSNAYGLLTVNATLEFDQPELRLGLWARNLTNTFYMANSVDFQDYIDAIPGEPRTYGLSLSYDFGPPRRQPPPR